MIAIVDDDEGIRTSLSSLIRSLGYEVCTYESCVDFLRDPRDPQCMIADIQMPVMTGDEMQARLIASGRNFPIIFMTAFPTDSVRDRVMSAGALCYLSKPASGDDIIRCLKHALEGTALK